MSSPRSRVPAAVSAISRVVVSFGMEGEIARGCELCGKAAIVFCLADDALFCGNCDRVTHEMNDLVRRHVRKAISQLGIDYQQGSSVRAEPIEAIGSRWGALAIKDDPTPHRSIVPNRGIEQRGPETTSPDRLVMDWPSLDMVVGHQGDGQSMNRPTKSAPKEGMRPELI